jgi:hypothetical protein
MSHADPHGAVRLASERGAEPPFWDRLAGLIAPQPIAPDSERPPTAFLHALRLRIAHRRSAETRDLFRTLGRLAAARIEAVAERAFSDLFVPAERGAIAQGLFSDLFDGGLARFRGADAAELIDWVTLLCDRAVLRAAVAKWARFEVRAAHGARYRDLLSADEVEELGADVLGELLTRGLDRFEGANDRQLYVYVRTTAHRAVSRAARRKVLHRQSVARLRSEAPPDSPPLLGRPAPAPSPRLRSEEPLAISADDQAYIEALLHAGGKLSSLAEARGVTRGSVTKRVQRILRRLDALEPDERERIGEWAEDTLVELHSRT